MIALCTGSPTVTVEDNRILVSLPSGKDKVQIALTLNQMLRLRASMMAATDEAFDTWAKASAEIVPFERKGARHG